MSVIETVTSPAGDQVDVVDDEPRTLWGITGPIVMALWNDGPFRSESGEATRPVYEAARRRGYRAGQATSLNHLFTTSLRTFVDRQTNGTRTYEVRLARIPKIWLDGRLDEARTPLTVREREKYRQVVCPLCGKPMGLNNLHRHLTQRHDRAHVEASRLVKVARRGAAEARRSALPAVVEHDDDDEPQPLLNDIPAIDLMTGMLSALRRDKMVPIRALPTLQEWLQQTERVLAELSREQ